MTVEILTKTTIDNDSTVLLAEIKNVEKLQISSIECILADNFYTTVFFNDNKILHVRQTLMKWESFLPKSSFIRINRWTIVNLDHVKSVEKSFDQTMVIYMKSFDKPLIMSRSYITKLSDRQSV